MAKKTAKANTASTVSTKAIGKKKEISGTKDSPWTLNTPSGQSEYQAYRDETLDPPALVVLVGKTELRYHLRCIDDLQTLS